MADISPTWTLAATCRCLTDDLKLDPVDCETPVEDLTSNAVIAAFVHRRTQEPEGQERILNIPSSLTAFSLHAGRYRAATWYDHTNDVVWLLAYAIHRAGSSDDAYEYFAQLYEAEKLKPMVQDVVRVLRLRRPTFEQSATEELPALRRRALSTPGEAQEALLGRRVRVRVIFENGDEGVLTIAISSHREPHGPNLPPDVHAYLVAAFFS